MKIKKILVSLFCVSLFATTISMSASAKDFTVNTRVVSPTTYENMEPRIDVIKYVYRNLDGRLQYRRWNETRGYWVDPDWIYA